MKKRLLVVLFVCYSICGFGQENQPFAVTVHTNSISLREVFEKLNESGPHKIFYLEQWIENISIQKDYFNSPVNTMLQEVFEGTDLSYLVMYPGVVVVLKDPRQEIMRKKSLQWAREGKKMVEQFTLGEVQPQSKGTALIEGFVKDGKSGDPLTGVNIQVLNSTEGTTTNEAGKFSITLPVGSYVLSVSQLEFESKVIDLKAYSNGTLDITLEKNPTLLDEVVVQAQTITEITTNRIGQIQLSMRELKRSPSFLGETDLIKQVQNLPGVTTVGEAAAGFNVRGGSVDQNLILFDGLPVFNSAHVFGFLSSFNSETIRDVNFYRGGIPAEYGGRVSSVLDIYSKDGSYDKWSGNAGIGLITSNVMMQGPLQKEKTSLIASVRSTYSNWLINSIRTDYADLRNSKVSFYDGTFKVAHRVNDRTKLSVTTYLSSDGFRLTGDTTYQWKSFLTSAKVDHQFSSELHGEFVLGTSRYGYDVLNDDDLTASRLSYQINTYVAKADFHYQKGLQKLSFGWQMTHYRFSPGMLEPNSAASNAERIALDKQYSFENAFYASNEWTFGSKLFLEGGVRAPLFLSLGPADVFRYQNEEARSVTTITDTVRYRSGELIKPYIGLEPRLSLRWNTRPNASVKFGYNHLYQYLHLVTNTTAVTPVDIWQPSGYYFKPQQADQISLGYFVDLKEKKYGASIEGFYKTVSNVVDFKDGAQLILNRHLETDLLQGRSTSYGIESFFSKNTGRFTGSMNYTYSRTFRTIRGATVNESINQGERYPANFDQPHVLNVSWKYNLSRRHFFTGNFTYHTGRPITIPLSVFGFENTSVAYFSARNQYRIPDYHRLDIALVLEGNHKRKKRMEGTWVISCYNVYARRNPYTVFFKGSGTGIPVPYQLSIVGTIFPSISYNIKFQ